MTEEHRADVKRVREVAERLGSPAQDVTPERDADERDSLQDEMRRRQAAGDHESPADRDG